MKTDGVLIFGVGGHGRVVFDILLESGANVLGFLDEDMGKAGMDIDGFKVLGSWDYLKSKPSACIALGIGNNAIRRRVFKKARDIKIKVTSAIHPKAVVSRHAAVGEGVVIMPGAVINYGTVIDRGAVVNTAASVDHDCRLGEFCQVWPGAHLAGSVKVGELSYVGTGASVIQNIDIGKNVTVGAGSVIIRDIPNNVTVAGNPARVIKNG